MDYQLVVPTELQLQTLYRWILEETEYEKFSCRPVKKPSSYENYLQVTLNKSEEEQQIKVLIAQDKLEQPLGQIKIFDYNERNQCAEVGYYLPPANRGKKLGYAMLQLFLNECFEESDILLNKIVATTSAGNVGSRELLKKCGFSQDGALRDHYWVGEEKYDQLMFSLLKSEFKMLKNREERAKND